MNSIALVDSGAATPDQLQDWAVLCRVVQESKRVLEWFDRLGPSYVPGPEHQWVMECCVMPLLKMRHRWADVGRLYVEPLRILETMHRDGGRHPEHHGAPRERLLDSSEY